MLEIIFLFVLGLVFGSFINVWALRWNSGLGLSGRSFCPICGKKLCWWELIPVLSFFFLKGRCGECKSKISWYYPMVEIWTGLVFATVYFSLLSVFNGSGLRFIFFYSLLIGVFSIYIVITVYDLRHKIIPDDLVYASIVLALILSILRVGSLVDYLAGPIFFLFFGSIWFLSRGKAMGLGDAKLGLSMGLLLGMSQGLSAMVLAIWIGASFGLFCLFLIRLSPLLRRWKNITMKSEIPFAPFMVLGAWLSFLFQLNILNVSFF